MTKVQEKKNGQKVVTIPKELATALDIQDGDDIDWSVESRNALRGDINRNRGVDDE